MIRHSGIGTYIRNIVPRVIDSLHSRDVIFHLLGSRKLLEEEGLGCAGVNLIEETSGIYSLTEQVSVIRCIPKNLDLLWVPHYNIPILYRGKLLVTVHDVCHLAVAEYNRRFIPRWYSRGMFKAISKNAAAVITVSQFSAHEITEYSGISPDQIVVIHNGVDDIWRTGGGNRRSGERIPYFVFVGNVKPHKNLARLISAFTRLIDILPHDLVVVGRNEGFIIGDEKSRRLAAQLQDRVRFTGYMSEPDLLDLLTHAEALIFPSLYEGFGLPVLEAMAVGCPVIAARASALPEVCGDAVLYVDPFDEQDIAGKMRQLSENKALASDLRIRGRARAMQFSWQASAHKTVAVLERVVAGRTPIACGLAETI